MLIISNSNIISNESLNFSFFLKSTSSPSPAFEHKPEIAAPNDMVPLIKSIVKAIDTAQFGINPITPVKTGSRILNFISGLLNKFIIAVSLIKKFKINVIIKTNVKTFNVCIRG